MIPAVPVIEPWRLLRAAVIVLALTSCTRAVSTQFIDAGRFGQVRLFRPGGAPRGVVFLFSDSTGWSDRWSRLAESLRAQRVAVIGVDLPSYLANLRKSGDGCHYLVSEIEDLSKRIQHELGSQEYFSPVLAGVGDGATLAYAALAQAPQQRSPGQWSSIQAVLQTRSRFAPRAPSQQRRRRITPTRTCRPSRVPAGLVAWRVAPEFAPSRGSSRRRRRGSRARSSRGGRERSTRPRPSDGGLAPWPAAGRDPDSRLGSMHGGDLLR
jgi:type IV secretory pathway VirJ component